jgi:hypothetical protein
MANSRATPTSKEYFDRFVKLKKLLQADAASLTGLRQSKVRKHDSFESCMKAILGLMKDAKTLQLNGKKSSLKEQLKLKGHNPKFDIYDKMAKTEIDDMATFYAGEVAPAVRRAKETAKAFRKAIKELASDVKQ